MGAWRACREAGMHKQGEQTFDKGVLFKKKRVSAEALLP